MNETSDDAILRKGEDGKIRVYFDKNQKMVVPASIKLPDDAEGKHVTVRRVDGKIVEIIIDGKSFADEQERIRMETANKAEASKHKQETNKSENTKFSKAPYNFIPLNDAVVESEHGSSIPDFGSYKDGLLSGYIDLTIDAKTPVYIRRVSDKSEFFEIGGRSLIPGSTIRGLTKNIMKIASFAKFQKDEDFEDRNLYYRAVGDPGSIGQLYKSFMIDANNNYFPKVKAGILKKKGREYIISPSSENEGTQFYRINGTFDASEEHFIINFEGNRRSLDCFSFKEIYFRPVRPQVHRHVHQNRDRREIVILLRYASLNEYSEYQRQGLKKGYLILSGKSPRKHMQWVINTADTGKPALPIPPKVIEDYEQDKSRNSVDLLKMLEKENEVPCFYLTDERGNITDFGHTALFRKRYSWSVGDHVPKKLNPEKDENKVSDIVEAIFGKLEHWAGRVYFEDAELQSNGANVFMDEATLKILSSPKPTCFQHYLEQPSGKNTSKHDLCHWDSEATIRGYKMYWHRNTHEQTGEYDWKERDPIPKNDTQHAHPIKPAKPGTKFRGRVRFENLSSVELGALLFSLDLPEGCCHKVGLGKPYGLGSVEIHADLVLVDRTKRYSKLFDGENWFLSEEKGDSSIDTYKKAFEEYVLSSIGKKELSSLWDHERMKELKSMLMFGSCSSEKWLEQTRYLKGGTVNSEYRDRRVLPKPGEVRSSIDKSTTK